jgi:putative ATPase
MDLFTQVHAESSSAPLAEKLRPQSLKAFLGQEHILAKYSSILKQFQEGHWISLLLWGPPGCGKTSFVKALLPYFSKVGYVEENAIDLGSKKLKEIGETARYKKTVENVPTVLFIDEIHRLNRGQQDVLLPFVERGDVVLMGATTENPSYELNSALLSRCRVLVFQPLEEKSLFTLLQRGCEYLSLQSGDLFVPEVEADLIRSCSGDGRKLLNTLEEIYLYYLENKESFPLSTKAFQELNFVQSLRYDKDRDEHYDTISAFIKSVRGSDPDAAIYYMARMLEAGEDPVFIARRLVILASEDIGNADPQALTISVSALQAVELVGMPEARINLAQAVTYLSSAPKSNAAYLAINKAMDVVKQTGNLPIPKALRSAQTALAKKEGYGKDYKYSHDGAKGWQSQTFLPDKIKDQKFYEPTERGFEKRISEYLKWMKS